MWTGGTDAITLVGGSRGGWADGFERSAGKVRAAWCLRYYRNARAFCWKAFWWDEKEERFNWGKSFIALSSGRLMRSSFKRRFRSLRPATHCLCWAGCVRESKYLPKSADCMSACLLVCVCDSVSIRLFSTLFLFACMSRSTSVWYACLESCVFVLLCMHVCACVSLAFFATVCPSGCLVWCMTLDTW